MYSPTPRTRNKALYTCAITLILRIKDNIIYGLVSEDLLTWPGRVPKASPKA